MTRVLHVTEAFGGGVATAISSLVGNSRDIEHHLMARIRTQDNVEVDRRDFASFLSFPNDPVRAVFAIRQAVERVQPNWVHLHSSIAGAYGRLAGLPKETLIYSSHGYAFLRRGNQFSSSIYRQAERWLSAKNSRFAAVGKGEARIALEVAKSQEIILVPNTVFEAPLPMKGRPLHGQKIKIVLVGRVSPQKDPHFLIEALSHLDTVVRDQFEISWVGGGDARLSDDLVQAGVSVSGWSDRAQVFEAFRHADLYVHIAAWEGFPMSLIEASFAGLPALVREIDILKDENFPCAATVETPQELAVCLRQLTSDSSEIWGASSATSLQIRADYSAKAQADSLRKLYSVSSF